MSEQPTESQGRDNTSITRRQRLRNAVLVFVGIEIIGLLLYMVGLRAVAGRLNLATIIFLLALVAAVITFLRYDPRPSNREMSELGSDVSPPTTSDAASPKRGSGRRRLLIIGGLIVAVVFVVYVGLSFLGAQVAEVLRGTVEFGTGGSGCTVDGRASKFTPGGSLFVVAYPSRDVPAGEAVTLRVLSDGVELASLPQTFGSALGKGDCLSGSMPGDAFTPGHYRFEYLAGTETLAAGEFDVAP